MNGGESQFKQAVTDMLDEIFFQAELSQTPHYFVYRFRDGEKGIAKRLDRDEQLEMLQILDSRGLIELSFNPFGVGDEKSYAIGLTDKGWSLYTKHRKETPSTVDDSHSAQLLFEDVYLKVVLDNKQQITIRRFQQDSDSYKLFTRLFNKPVGYTLRLNEIFPNYDNLTKVLKDTKLGYLLPIFFADIGSKELQLLKMPVAIDGNNYSLLLSKSK